ncbi:site-specific DNA-methyltransferase [Pseudomonas entomophila]|uniref:DNA-methyltransferase n=1 Tax=Pseudomonas entomophila TaxID=312306 RepID=UPI0015E47669|nr:site-specific DNA-methyltransferase [Pseudomonas entomophila]MBA1192812.1 site-specific DNA-methyltransferase [Pseudomonas entomophila]
MNQYRILIGDCIDMMRTLPDQSVHTCITSPPYFGLRDYGVDGQIGLEASPREFIDRLVAVFREVRRVLRDDGTAWVNMGDSYAGSWGAHGRDDMGLGGQSLSARQVAASARRLKKPNHHGFKPKDLLGLPWRLAIALQDDGWYLRQDIIWHKPNPMPESIKDRCTKAHEYVFLLSKGPRYYFDQAAIREPASAQAAPESASRRNSFARQTKYTEGEHGQTGQHRETRADVLYDETRNKRSVWTVATASFKGAHFATFPPDLVRPCVLAGAPRGGLVLDPFGGAGTTALVAMQEGRRSVICELNPEYAALAHRRLDTAWVEGAAQMDILLDQSPAA